MRTIHFSAAWEAWPYKTKGVRPVEKSTLQLAESIETLAYYFGVYGIEGECCEHISHGEYRALCAVLQKDVCTMRDIARSAFVTKSGATRIVQRLEKRGLIQRERNEDDGRVCCVTLTEEGASFLSRNNEDLMQTLQGVVDAMDPTLKEILVLSIGAFSRALCERAGKEAINGPQHAPQRHDHG